MRRRPGSAGELAASMQAEEEQRYWARERGCTAEREESQKLHPNLNLPHPAREPAGPAGLPGEQPTGQ